ncbi:MAG: hypothetical protein QOF72_3009 [Blastocatellia bacterium]|jgi:hypothetical protein|nr:hypothetical protein [Blastocatellia bacterium]
MQKGQSTLVSKYACLTRALAILIAFAFTAQATHVFSSSANAAPRPAPFSVPKTEFPESDAQPPVVSRTSNPATKSLPKRNHSQFTAKNGAISGKSRLGVKRFRTRKGAAPDCQGCKDDCLTFSLECIGLSALGGCGPCAAICLAEQIRCQLKCPCAQVVVNDN